MHPVAQRLAVHPLHAAASARAAVQHHRQREQPPHLRAVTRPSRQRAQVAARVLCPGDLNRSAHICPRHANRRLCQGQGIRELRGREAPARGNVITDWYNIPMAKGFVYLIAVMDWFSRRVLAWRMSITMEAYFCVEALQETIARHGRPEIFNTDQGVQFTSAGFLDELESRGIRVSMDDKGRFLDNIFIERLWRSLKYEAVFIKAYGSVAEARRGIGGWLSFYNEERLHQALGYRTPRAVFDGEAHEPVDNASALNGCGVGHRLVGTELKRKLAPCRIGSILG
ncbi:MAG TPA: hypothetical protein DDZ81_10050 [Acetobacteraceae bacterium]|nr:hypothetical protein [Acetobacteraceae bacterium]